MNNYEKAVLSNGSAYDIVPGGLRESAEALSLILLPGEKNLLQIDEEMDNPTNTGTILIQDVSGVTINIKKGYVYQAECRKVKDYVIGRELVTDPAVVPAAEPVEGETPAESVEQEYRDITGTVVSIVLKKADVRQELEVAKAEITSLNATVDALVIKALEG